MFSEKIPIKSPIYKSCFIVSHSPRCSIEHQFYDKCRVKTLKCIISTKLNIPLSKIHILRFGVELYDDYEFHNPCYVSFYVG